MFRSIVQGFTDRAKTLWRFPSPHRWLALALVSAIASLLLLAHTPAAASGSSYALSQQAAFNQPSHYPIAQSPPSDLYRPTADWIGRLLLPSMSDVGSQNTDWVWIELYHVPAAAPAEIQALVGSVVRLEWSEATAVQAYREVVTTDVQITQAARRYENLGNIIPNRLDGRSRVGPLQSLAGARPNDDVEVQLQQVTVATDGNGQPMLQIAAEPIQITGRFYGLVKIIAPDDTVADRPSVCPGSPPCPIEYMRVQHYRSASGQFDGPVETIRIPQQLPDANGRFFSTPRQIHTSAAGEAGWYIYGAPDGEGVFTVQALKPRSLVQMQPDQIYTGLGRSLRYLYHQNWQNMGDRKGTAQTTWLQPSPLQDAAMPWQEGDRALMIHLFGGIGGEQGEAALGWTVTGHFSYGVATVVREPLADELQFDLQYQQIYAHNPNAIVAGPLDWTAYTGNLQRGWLGIRPLSDILVRLDGLATPLQIGDSVTIPPLDELLVQAQIMAARYRTGDGTGVAAVTPAASCVQDSNQALYIAIKRMEQTILSTPGVGTWLQNHPEDPATRQFKALIALGVDLNRLLVPRQVVRPDWRQNANVLSGIEGDGTLSNTFTLQNVLLSWRTLLPRAASDEISSIFLKHGAQLWVLRTDQVGGWDDSIAPRAPTAAFGQLPLISRLFHRSVSAILAPLSDRAWALFFAVLIGYGAIALLISFWLSRRGNPTGGLFSSGLLQVAPVRQPLVVVKESIRILLFPALLQEWIFRVLLLPHPTEIVILPVWMGYGMLSILLFVAYHPLLALTIYPKGRPTFFKPAFLLLVGLLGLACTILYSLTESLWLTALLHGSVLIIWQFGLGGYQRLHSTATLAQAR